MSDTAAARYVMGHTDRERRRLALQASILNPFTEQLLRRAGVAGGMRVLDVGCGLGDLSLLAARLVGRHGSVTAIDLDPAALSIAEERAREEGFENVSFLHAQVDQYVPERPFDAVIGRHILIHTPEPLSLLKKARTDLVEGGVAVFQEYDFSVIHSCYPRCPLFERTMLIFHEFFCKVIPGDVGTRLFHLFLDAGFTAPDCRVEHPIDGGPDSPFYEWIAESMRTILPRAQALGMAQEAEVDIDTLAQRLREEAVSLKAGCPAPCMVGGFARKR